MTDAIFAGAFIIVSLQNGLSGYRSRLGADIVAIPSSATGHGTVDDIFLQGIAGNYYMSEKDVENIKATRGIDAVTTQFFLTSAKASCCSSRVQIIGFDPDTDFVIKPWIDENYSGEIADGDIVVGANVNVPLDRTLKFYGHNYRISSQLAKTGTGLDSAVFTNMNTIRQMAKDSASLFQSEYNENAVSAVMIKVMDGYEINDVADDINIHITKVRATPSREMIADIAEGLGNVSAVIGAFIGLIWLLAAVILMVVFAMLSNERRKEFAVLRSMGASRSMLFSIIASEAVIISLAGAFAGLLTAILTAFPFFATLQSALNLPFLMPDMGMTLAIGLVTLFASAFLGILTATLSARTITKSETGLLLKEDA